MLDRARLKSVMTIADKKLRRLGIHLDFYVQPTKGGSESSELGAKIYFDSRDAIGFGAAKRGSLNLLLHELGHKFQTQLMSKADRSSPEFTRLFGPYYKVYKRKPGVKNEKPEFISKYSQAHPQEDFAEVFAMYVDLDGDMDKIKAYLRKRKKGPFVLAQMQWLDNYVKHLKEDHDPTAQSFDKLTSECVAEAKKLGMQISYLPNGSPVLVHGKSIELAILSGTHGDERSGPVFLRDLLRKFSTSGLPKFGIAIIPLLNDDGWDKDKRTHHNRDLNRAFGKEKVSPVTEALKSALAKLKPKFFWDIHEDENTERFYIFKNAKDKGTFHDRLAVVAGVKPTIWHTDNGIWKGRDAESFVRKLGATAFTSEAPPSTPLKRRLAWLGKIYKWLEQEIASAG